MRHPVQRRHLEKEFRRLLREGAGVHPRPEEGLAAKEGGLSQTPAMVARVLFPPPAPQAPDRPQVLIALPRRTLAVAVLPNLGVPARRHHRRGPARGECIVAGALVIGPGGTDLADFSLYLRYQIGQDRIIRHPGFARHGRDNLARGLIYRQVQFAPGAPLAPAMLAHFPLALAVDLEAA